MRTLSTNNIVRRRSTRGAFTFVELMVVTLLIALLAGSSIRGSVQTFRKMQVERAAREVYLAAQFARIQAIESGRSCQVILDPKTRSISVTAMVKKGPQLVRNAYSRPYQFAEDVNYERIDITPTRPPEIMTDEETMNTTITFRPDGSADGAVVQIGNGRTHWSVYISSATGSVRTENGVVREQSPSVVIDLDRL